jgi:hypothetical protein
MHTRNTLSLKFGPKSNLDADFDPNADRDLDPHPIAIPILMPQGIPHGRLPSEGLIGFGPACQLSTPTGTSGSVATRRKLQPAALGATN